MLNVKIVTNACFGAILFLVPISGQASELEPFVGLSTGYFINPEGVPFNGELGVNYKNGAFWVAGYQFSNDLESSSSSTKVDTKWVNVSLGYKGEPVWSLSPFLQVGASFYDIDVSSGESDEGVSPGFEVGVIYDLSNNISLKTSYQYYDSLGNSDIGVYDSNALLLGVRYNFGNASEVKTEQSSLEYVPEIKQTADMPVTTPKLPVLEKVGTISFDFDSSLVIKDDIGDYFDATIQECNQLLIVGHADNAGSEEYNYKLGLERANQVLNALFDLGLIIDKTKVRIESKGETEPMYDNSSPKRSMNRRAEIYVLRDVKGN